VKVEKVEASSALEMPSGGVACKLVRSFREAHVFVRVNVVVATHAMTTPHVSWWLAALYLTVT
jgi:hypothetical protein